MVYATTRAYVVCSKLRFGKKRPISSHIHCTAGWATHALYTLSRLARAAINTPFYYMNSTLISIIGFWRVCTILCQTQSCINNRSTGSSNNKPVCLWCAREDISCPQVRVVCACVCVCVCMSIFIRKLINAYLVPYCTWSRYQVESNINRIRRQQQHITCRYYTSHLCTDTNTAAVYLTYTAVDT